MAGLTRAIATTVLALPLDAATTAAPAPSSAADAPRSND